MNWIFQGSLGRRLLRRLGRGHAAIALAVEHGKKCAPTSHGCAVLILGCFLGTTSATALGDDSALQNLINQHGLQPLAVPQTDATKVDLGRSLFFDRELSGNRDVSCATCHHPSLGSGDGRALPSGVGGEGLGGERTQAVDRNVVPRNAPEVFHRGDEAWTTMFWDSRLADEGGIITSPAGDQLPAGFDRLLSIQAMFPVTSRAEMRGDAGDLDVFGQVNEVALVADDDLTGIWNALMNRLMTIPAYQQAFEEAYPGLPRDQMTFQHVANAIAEFEVDAFSPQDSAWDRYLAGDRSALSPAAVRGASHFLGGSCASCHSGDLLTDQQHHNLAVPQLGPGKDASGLDLGRALETGDVDDQFAFRTPPLRNVTATGPWFHNGSYANLEDVIRHHFAPEQSLTEFDVNSLPEHLQATLKLDPSTVDALTKQIDSMLPVNEPLTEEVLHDLMAFLGSLTSPSIDQLLHVTPDEVLSGLDVDQQPKGPLDLEYDPTLGSLALVGEEGLALDALFLRFVGDDAPEFALGAAPWSELEEIVLSDQLDAQSFLDFYGDPKMLLFAGDVISSLLPADISEVDLEEHLQAAYRVHGSPTLWTANVTSVPEPSAGWLLLVGAALVARVKRRD